MSTDLLIPFDLYVLEGLMDAMTLSGWSSRFEITEQRRFSLKILLCYKTSRRFVTDDVSFSKEFMLWRAGIITRKGPQRKRRIGNPKFFKQWKIA